MYMSLNGIIGVVFVAIGILISKQLVAGPPTHLPPEPSHSIEKGFKIISNEELTPKVRSQNDKILKELKSKGFLEVSNERTDNYEKNLTRSYKTVGFESTNSTNASIGAGELDNVLGSPILYGPKVANKQKNESIKVYKGTNGEIISLKVKAALGALVQKDRINTDVNGHPAISMTLKSKGGGLIKSLTWFTQENIFKLEYVYSSKLLQNVQISDSSIDAQILEMARLIN